MFQILIPSKGPLICYSKLTHTNMYLTSKHDICPTLIHSITPYHSSSNIYPWAASTSQNRNINKALIIKYIHHVSQSRNLNMFTNQIKCMFMQLCMTYLIAPQHLCIDACSCSYVCSCDSTKIQTLIINSTINASETCYSTNPRPKHVKTRPNKT